MDTVMLAQQKCKNEFFASTQLSLLSASVHCEASLEKAPVYELIKY